MKWSGQVPLQNRVDPFGVIHAVRQRGMLMGNRGGKIHDTATKTLLKRSHASWRWIICECVYKNWHREVMGAGYTELFFLDEVTALAAGHRPCAFCRRTAFKQYQHSSGRSDHSVDKLDRILHTQRLGEKSVLNATALTNIPDGIVVAIEQTAFAKRGLCAFYWSFDGYSIAGSWAEIAAKNPHVLTPALTIIALQNGYQPHWHPSVIL